MIPGIVNQSLEATIDLTVRGPGGHEERLEFVVDTGFAGELSLHSAVAAALELPEIGAAILRLADGSRVWSTMSQAQVVWNGTVRTVSVNVTDNVGMLGMELLEGHELSIRVVGGGEVRISELSDFILEAGSG